MVKIGGPHVHPAQCVQVGGPIWIQHLQTKPPTYHFYCQHNITLSNYHCLGDGLYDIAMLKPL